MSSLRNLRVASARMSTASTHWLDSCAQLTAQVYEAFSAKKTNEEPNLVLSRGLEGESSVKGHVAMARTRWKGLAFAETVNFAGRYADEERFTDV